MTDQRLVAVELDQLTIGKADEAVEHERRVAIADLLDSNTFHPADSEAGPYALRLAIEDQRLVSTSSARTATPFACSYFLWGRCAASSRIIS